jgi:hypothetical protein
MQSNKSSHHLMLNQINFYLMLLSKEEKKNKKLNIQKYIKKYDI